MGWDYIRGYTKQDVINEIIRERDYDNGTKLRTLGSSLHGSRLWAVIETQHPDGTRSRQIVLALIKKSQGDWGYKTMTHNEHPFYYDCPQRFVDMLAPEDFNEYGRAWLKARMPPDPSVFVNF